MKYVAKTFFGLEELLSIELVELGASNVQILSRAVSFEADLRALYKINLWSRIALRILSPIKEFSAHNEIVYYKRLSRMDWGEYLDLNTTFSINSTVHSDIFTHSKYIALKTKDAIVDQFRARNDGKRPSIDIKNPAVVFDVYCTGKDFIISLDSSAESLHRRGYRQSNRAAPLNEALAAGMIMLAGWNGDRPLYDPMCGSATLLTEAYMIAAKRPPRESWTHFGFMNWPDYDPKLWQEIVEEAKDLRCDVKVPIHGSDNDSELVRETKHLLFSMDVQNAIQIEASDFFKTKKPYESGSIITNPPYGQRIEVADIEGFYKQIGDKLKTDYSDWDAWILSANKQAMKNIGLRTSARNTLYNGPSECRYYHYEMYQGSRK